MTAVAPVVVETRGMWVGWPGVYTEDNFPGIPESHPDDKSPTAGLRSEQVGTSVAILYSRKILVDFYKGAPVRKCGTYQSSIVNQT